MPYIATTATKRLLGLRKRIRAVAGGTSASKTVSILLILIDKAQSDKSPKTTHIVSESLPHLKLAAMADFLKIMKEHRYYDDGSWHKSDYVYTFPTGSTFQFYGAESHEKVHGPRRDRLFINEANHIPYQSFDQMEVRTNGEVWLDWNPSDEFWFYTDVLPNRKDDTDFVTLTYKDNEGLPEPIVKSIEARKHNKRWWKVYGEGQLGESDNRIYTGWRVIDGIPEHARLERYGLDFGYTNDPTVIIAIYSCDGRYILDEVAYERGLSNQAIAQKLLALQSARVVADSSEPKSIDEILTYGVKITGCVKGPGSVNTGIQHVQGLDIDITANSVKTLKGYRNYVFYTDRDGKITNDPDDSVHEWSNPMDAVRYGLQEVGRLRPVKKERAVAVSQTGGNKLGYKAKSNYKKQDDLVFSKWK
jgi:phage terminase large subunit